jgi:hypothetical protein
MESLEDLLRQQYLHNQVQSPILSLFLPLVKTYHRTQYGICLLAKSALMSPTGWLRPKSCNANILISWC